MALSLPFAACWKDLGLPGEAMGALHPLAFLCSTPSCFQEYFTVGQLIPASVCQIPHLSQRDVLAIPVGSSREGEAGHGSDMTGTCKADEAVPSCSGYLQKNPCPKVTQNLDEGFLMD